MNAQERAAFESWFQDFRHSWKTEQDVASESFSAGYRAALAAAPVQAVPGWALVPLHATPEMVSAAEGVEDLYKRGTPQTWAAVFRAMLAAAPAAPQAPAVPHPGSPEASAMIDSELAARGWPSNAKNAARAGYEACRKLAAAHGAPQPAEPAPRWLTKEEIDPLIEQARDAFYPADMNPHFERCLVWLALRAAGVKEPGNAGHQGREASPA